MSCRTRPGFSLLEAVIALAIVGVTAVAALGAAGTDLRATERARNALEAEALATDRLSAIRLLTDEELRQMPDSVGHGRFPEPFSHFEWKATAEPTLGEEGLMDVAITILWPNGAYEMSTKIYRRPAVIFGTGTGT